MEEIGAAVEQSADQVESLCEASEEIVEIVEATRDIMRAISAL